MADEEPSASPPPNGNGRQLPHDPISQLRQVVAGLLGIAIACYDRWNYPKEGQGFANNIDELLLLISLGILAGVAGIFRLPGAPPPPPPPPPPSPPVK